MAPHPTVHRFLTGLALAILLVTGLIACQSIGMNFGAGSIAPADRIPLQPSGSRQGEGRADTGQLVVSYAYEILPGAQRQFRLRGGIASVRTRADSVSVLLNQVDDAGRVISKTILYASGYRPPTGTRRPATFDIILNLSPDTTAIAFSSHVIASRGRR